jgi:hypothetical protein
MANSTAMTITFWDISATFSGSLSEQSDKGTMVFPQEVAIGSLIAKDWATGGVALPFPYGKEDKKIFNGQSFEAEWKKDSRLLTIYLTNNQHWFLLATLDEQNKAVGYSLVFQPKKGITIKKLPGIKKPLKSEIVANVSIYFAPKDIVIQSLDIKKGISSKAQINLGSKEYTFPKEANKLMNCASIPAPLSINQGFDSVLHIDTLGFKYRPEAKNPITKVSEPNCLFLELKLKNTPLTVLKGKLKAIRIGFILDKLHLMQHFSWESNLALEVDFNIPVMNKTTKKRQVISLRPMQWLRKIGFPPSWFPSFGQKKKPEEAKGITITKADLKNIKLIKDNDDFQSLIPDKTVLERVVYDWKTHDLELAVKVNFQSPLSLAELQTLESTHTDANLLLKALQAEGQKRDIDTTGKSKEDLKKALNSYTGGFALNNYPEIFKVNQVAIYINPKEVEN